MLRLELSRYLCIAGEGEEQRCKRQQPVCFTVIASAPPPLSHAARQFVRLSGFKKHPRQFFVSRGKPG